MIVLFILHKLKVIQIKRVSYGNFTCELSSSTEPQINHESTAVTALDISLPNPAMSSTFLEMNTPPQLQISDTSLDITDSHQSEDEEQTAHKHPYYTRSKAQVHQPTI